MLSIIIPIYNRAALVGETLDSIVAQTRTDWECIVVDDGSTDASVEVVQRYVAQDSRIQLLHRPVDRIKGAPTCRNYGFEHSKGQYVYFFDSDDLLSPEFVEVVLKNLEKNPDAEYAAVPWDTLCELSVRIRSLSGQLSFNPRHGTLFEQYMCNKAVLWTSCFLWKRSFLEALPMLWRDGLPCYQDTDFIRRSLCHAEHGIWIEMKPAAHYRIDLINSRGIITTNMKDPIGMTKTRCFVHSSVYKYCVETGRMTGRIHRLYVRLFFRAFLCACIISDYPLVGREWHNLLVSHLKETFHDHGLRFFAAIIFHGRPLLRGLARLAGYLRPSFARKAALANAR